MKTAVPAACWEAVNALVALLTICLPLRGGVFVLLVCGLSGVIVLLIRSADRLGAPTPPTRRTKLMLRIGAVATLGWAGMFVVAAMPPSAQLLDHAHIDPMVARLAGYLMGLAAVLMAPGFGRALVARDDRLLLVAGSMAAAGLALGSVVWSDGSRPELASLLSAVGAGSLLLVVDQFSGLFRADIHAASGSSSPHHAVRMLIRATSIGVALIGGLLTTQLLPHVLGVPVDLSRSAIAVAVVGFVLTLALAVLLRPADRSTPSS